MPPTSPEAQSFVFVVTLRREPREIPGASETWRGSVRRVPGPSDRINPDKPEPAAAFAEIDELSGVIRRLVGLASKR